MAREIVIELPAIAGPLQVELRFAVGDRILRGDTLAVIETDRATQELDADFDGVIQAVTKTARGIRLIVDEE